jgi:uncharacterized protein involved in exopolysaccharide biosynthesis
MKKRTVEAILGVLLITLALLLTKTSVYTSVKGLVLDAGGSIGVAVTTAIGLIIISFISGNHLLNRR